MSTLPSELASTIQAGHIEPHPSVAHDANPSSTFSEKKTVTLQDELDAVDDEVDDDDGIDDEQESINSLDAEDEVLYTRGRRLIPRFPRRPHHLPPMPDLRFEQSYLHSIRNADTWWKVVWITVRDQVMMPFLQGVLYNLALCGWHYWNRNARIHGSSVGARLRRWWYRVNNWAIPPEKRVRVVNVNRWR